MNPVNFFDLYDVFVNELVGDFWLFVFIALLIIVYLSINNKISVEATVLLIVVFLGIIVAKVGDGALIIWVLVVLAVGTFAYFIYQRLINRG